MEELVGHMDVNLWRVFTYDVAGGVFLLSGEDTAGTLGGVQGALALDNGLAGATSAAAGLAADLGDGVPVFHFVCVF